MQQLRNQCYRLGKYCSIAGGINKCRVYLNKEDAAEFQPPVTYHPLHCLMIMVHVPALLLPPYARQISNNDGRRIVIVHPRLVPILQWIVSALPLYSFDFVNSQRGRRRQTLEVWTWWDCG